MKLKGAGVVLALLGLALAGCAPATKYQWRDYNGSLYKYYKSPAYGSQLAVDIKAIIDNSESRGLRVPPGIYAEYGYLLLQQGDSAEAIGYFNKEKNAWPESSAFMTSMVAAAGRGSVPAQSAPLPPQGAPAPQAAPDAAATPAAAVSGGVH